jgi:hypothetical protein
MLARMPGKKNPHTLLMGMPISTTTMENSNESPQKLKIELPYDLAIPLLGIYLKECMSDSNKGTCTLMFMGPLFTIAKLWK